MRIIDYGKFVAPDEGKQFIITEAGKLNIVNWRHKEVGTVVNDYDCPAHYWNEKYIEEVDIPGWTTIHGYVVGYYTKDGYWISAGNHQNFYTKEIAETYKAEYLKNPWVDNEIIIREQDFMGVPLPPYKYFNGEPIVDKEHYFGLDAHKVGSYFSEEQAMYFANCVPPKTFTRYIIQCGEPHSTVGNKMTYATFVRITDDIWQYVGNCHKNERVEP